MSLYFRAIGEPIPQGSMKGYVRAGRVALTSDNPRLHSWRDVIGWEARKHVTDLIDYPVSIELGFILTRPKSVSKKRRPFPSVKPDNDKLIRAACDAMTGVVWKDDALVITIASWKRYAEDGEQPGVSVRVREFSGVFADDD